MFPVPYRRFSARAPQLAVVISLTLFAAPLAAQSREEPWTLIQPPQASVVLARDGSLIGEIGKERYLAAKEHVSQGRLGSIVGGHARAYNLRAQDGGVFLIAPLQLEAPRTKAITALLGMVGIPQGSGLNTLILTDGSKQAVYMSARNLQGVQVRAFGEESAYDLLWADVLVIEAPALDRAEEVAHA